MADKSMFSERLRKARTTLGLTQKDLATKVGIAAATLSAYEASGKPPTIETAMKLADILGVSLDWLCGRDEPESPVATYGEAIALIDRLARSGLNVSMEVRHKAGEDGDAQAALLVIRDDMLAPIFEEWANALSLYASKTIDDELYDPWIERQAESRTNMAIAPQ